MLLRKTAARFTLLFVACAVLGAAYSVVTSAQQPAATQRATIFENARLIIGDQNAPIERGAFVVVGNRITAVGVAGQVQAPAGATRVDLTGKTVIPAFVDMHSHLGYNNSETGRDDEKNYTLSNVVDHLERFAYTGHASTFSMGSDTPEFIDKKYSEDPKNFSDLRVDSMKDTFTGARFMTVGRGLAWPGTGNGRSSTFYPIVSPWLAKTAVRELASQGVKFMKLWVEDRQGFKDPRTPNEAAFLHADESLAAITEGHKLGIKSIGHVKVLNEFKDLLRNKVDATTHPIADKPLDAEAMALLKALPDFRYIPAITPAGQGGSAPRAAGQRPEWLKDPLLTAVMCPQLVENWGQGFEKSGRVPAPNGGVGSENVARIYKAGVHFALGSHDAGGTRPLGWGTHMEAESFVNWVGMAPREVLISMTSAPADYIGVGDTLGRIAVGKEAAFLVLDGNPLEDIRNTRKINQVYLRGRMVDRPAMKAKWAARCSAVGAIN